MASSKFLTFDNTDSKSIIYEREGFFTNTQKFELDIFYKSYKDKLDEIRVMTNDPDVRRDLGDSRDKLVKKY